MARASRKSARSLPAATAPNPNPLLSTGYGLLDTFEAVLGPLSLVWRAPDEATRHALASLSRKQH
jgi:hypothetical protein